MGKHAEAQILVRGAGLADQTSCHVRFGTLGAQSKGLRDVGLKIPLPLEGLQRGRQWAISIRKGWIDGQTQIRGLQSRLIGFLIRRFISQEIVQGTF